MTNGTQIGLRKRVHNGLRGFYPKRPQGGRISFNSAATRMLRELKFQAVLLLWDRAAGKFAIRKSSERDVRRYRLRFQKRNTIISAKAFLRHIHYDFSETRTLPTTWKESQRMFEVEVPRARSRGEK